MLLTNILTCFLTLFAVINIIGMIPLIIKLREEEGHIESGKSTIISIFIMVFILYAGQSIFKLLGIEIFHFSLAGSMLILFFGIKMVLGIEQGKSKSKNLKATVFPLAFPIISGPGTMSTLLSLKPQFNNIEIITSILLNGILIFIVLKTADFIKEQIGLNGILILERIFGIILTAIGMKILLQSLILSINYAQNLI